MARGRRRPTRRRSSAPWRALRRTCARRWATRRRRARSRRKRSPPRRWRRCAPTPIAQDLSTEPARRRGGGEVSRSAALRPRVRPRLLGPRGEPVPPGKPRGSREELERGAAPHRSHDRARKAADVSAATTSRIARNPDKAIETYEQLVAKYPADSAGYNNLAIAYFNTLNFAKALEYGRKAIDIYPKTFKYRSNYALYAMYAGDFKTAAETAQPLIKEDPKVDVPYLPLAMEALAAGDVPRARSVYQQVTQAGDSGVSLSALGLADIAMYEGRYDEAIAILPAAAKRDQDQQNILGAASKLVALAEAYQARGNDRARQTAIAQARALSTQENVLVPAARLAIARGTSRRRAQDRRRARAAPSAQSRAYAKMIEGEIAIAAKQYVDGPRCAQRRAEACGPVAGPLRAGPRLLPSWRITPKPSRNSRSAASGAARRRRSSSTTCRPFHYYATAALLARARARDAEARRALAVPGVPAHPPGCHGRSARRGRAAPDRIRRALIFLGVPPRPRTIGERCASAGYRHRHRPGGSRDDSRDGRDDGRDSGGERIEFDASSRHRRRRLR